MQDPPDRSQPADFPHPRPAPWRWTQRQGDGRGAIDEGDGPVSGAGRVPQRHEGHGRGAGSDGPQVIRLRLFVAGRSCIVPVPHRLPSRISLIGCIPARASSRSSTCSTILRGLLLRGGWSPREWTVSPRRRPIGLSATCRDRSGWQTGWVCVCGCRDDRPVETWPRGPSPGQPWTNGTHGHMLGLV